MIAAGDNALSQGDEELMDLCTGLRLMGLKVRLLTRDRGLQDRASEMGVPAERMSSYIQRLVVW